VFWRNERYEILREDYSVIEAGRARLSYGALRRRSEIHFYRRDRLVFFLHGDEVTSYSINIFPASHDEHGFDLTVTGMLTIKERIETHQKTSQETAIRLRNRQGVYSSHPTPLSAQYPFYTEKHRSLSFRSRVNPDALYP